MSWKAITKDGFLLAELNEDGSPTGLGRPVQAGQDGQLALVAEEDFGHKIAIDLNNGIVAIDYQRIGVQNGTIELDSPLVILNICEETSIVGDMRHLHQVFNPDKDENGEIKKDDNGETIYARTDYMMPLIWRPIWFIRHINTYGTIKIIGAQTTLPASQGGTNIKKLISIFEDGRLGID